MMTTDKTMTRPRQRAARECADLRMKSHVIIGSGR
jgi:hypothetical protein